MEIQKSIKAKKKAAQALTTTLQKYSNSPVLLLLSGGSWFAVLDLVDTTLLAERDDVTISMLDERFSTNPLINNFSQLIKTDFYVRTSLTDTKVISTLVTKEVTLEAVQQKWYKTLHNWRENNPTGVVIATIGIGGDGHLAGIFPNELAVAEADKKEAWTVAYEVGARVNQYTKRMTVTPYFLTQEITEAIVYAVGAEKHALLTQIQSPLVGETNIPAFLLRKLPSVQFFTDV